MDPLCVENVKVAGSWSATRIVANTVDLTECRMETGRDAAENIPDAELRIIPGMGYDLPAALVKTVADAITTAASRATGARQAK